MGTKEELRYGVLLQQSKRKSDCILKNKQVPLGVLCVTIERKINFVKLFVSHISQVLSLWTYPYWLLLCLDNFLIFLYIVSMTVNLLFYLGCCSCYSVWNVQGSVRYQWMPIHTCYFYSCTLSGWSIGYDDDWHVIIQLYFIWYYLMITWNEYFIHVLFCMSVPAHKISKALWWSIYWSTINTMMQRNLYKR